MKINTGHIVAKQTEKMRSDQSKMDTITRYAVNGLSHLSATARDVFLTEYLFDFPVCPGPVICLSR